MKEILYNYWSVILILLGLIGLVMYLVIKRKWDKLRQLAFTLIKLAEKAIIGSKKGQERFNLILDQIYNLIPSWFKLFITKTYMEEKLQEWYNLIKDSLDDGKINNSLQQQKPPDTILK